MSNSSLATYIDRRTGNYNTRKSLISTITLHIALATGTCKDLSNMLTSTTSGSFHYGVATDGTIGLYVDEKHRAWGTGDVDHDESSIHIMIMNSNTSDNYPISDKSYEAVVALCTDICRRNYIRNLTYSGSKDSSNLCRHDWFSTDSSLICPGEYLASKLADIAKEVTEALQHVNIATSETEALKSQSMIVVDAIRPYLAQISKDATNVDYAKLKNSGVVGVMIEIGKLSALNTNLKKQVSQVTKGNLVYSLLWESEASSKADVMKECNRLYYIISKYPPKLGIWIYFSKTRKPAVFDEVLTTFYNVFMKWGLASKCGIQVTREVLKDIRWEGNFSAKFSLWLISHLEDVTNIEELAVPSMFKLAEREK